ncbi:MAG: MFS transporter [Rhodospirillales bacterium]|nr:MFS transporter [Rhodospirillales bacterium]
MAENIPTSAAPTAALSASWADLFRNGLAPTTLILNLGVLLFGIDVYLIASIMPTVIADVGGMRLYTWTFVAFSMGSIVGTSSAEPIRRAFGRRNGYAAAGVIFLIATLGSAMSGSITTLVFWRLIQGLGAGSIVSQSYGMIGEVVPAHLRARALAFISATWGLATIIGPTFGGVFAEMGSWRGAFWAVTPIAALFIILVWRFVPATQVEGTGKGFPTMRLGLLAAAIMCLSYSSQVDTITTRIILVALSAAMTTFFFLRDSHAENRMLPSRAMSLWTELGAAYWILVVVSVVHTMIAAFATLFLQVLHSQPPLIAAYVFALTSFLWTTGAVIVGGLTGRAVAISIGIGVTFVFLGTIGVAVFVLSGPVWALAICFIMIGTGTGMSYNHLIAWSIAAAPDAEKPVAASSAATMRALGLAFGAAIAGLLAAASGLVDGAPKAIIEEAMTVVYNSNVLIALVPIAAGLILWRNARRRAEETAA